MKKSTLILLSSVLTGLSFFSCQSEKKSTFDNRNTIKFSKPLKNQNFHLGDTISIDFLFNGRLRGNDKINFYLNKEKFAQVDSSSLKSSIIAIPKELGRHQFSIEYPLGNGKYSIKKRTVTVLSNIEPKKMKVMVVQEFKHNPTAFTQGLEFKDNFLYESTGQEGQSVIRKVDLFTGNTIEEKAIEKELFGEGITIFNDKVYQLTYKSLRGFVYNLNTLEREREFSYSTEGWGLTHNDSLIIMSDGSSKLSFLDPETLKVKYQKTVYTNKAPIAYLNELEWVNGFIYANIFTKDIVVKIEAKTGRVIEMINASELKKRLPKTTRYDVLNGIAHNSNNGKLYMTGKLWPKLFEVVIVSE